MKVTKEVILDLLPLYLADEVSEDTKVLVEEYLKTDPELEKIAKEFASEKFNDIDIPLKKEDKLEAYMKVKQLQIVKTIVFGVLISGVVLAIMAAVMMFVR